MNHSLNPAKEKSSSEFIDLVPIWKKLAVKLSDFGIAKRKIKKLEKDFLKCLGIVKKLNSGENILGEEFLFEKNYLRYHSFEHTVWVVKRTIQILPGFLAELKERGIDPKTNLSKIRGLLYAALFHEIGYLKRKKGDEPYQTQGELYFDHVDRGMNFAPAILSKIGLNLKSKEIVFLKQMIRATDFNLSWQEKEKEGLKGEVREWGQILWAADFLSNFTHPNSIPQIVSGLYWENLSRVVKKGRVYTWKRNPDQTLKKELKESKDPLNDYTRIYEAKFAIISSKEYEAKSPSFFDFVASNFLFDMNPALEKYINYADFWPWKKGVNEIRRNYDLNKEKIKLLQEKKNIGTIDRFSIFEGAFTGYDLHLWVEEMERKGLIKKGYKPTGGWYEIDKKILGIKQTPKVLPRLATANLREILSKVKKEKITDSLVFLLQRYRKKIAGEGLKKIYLFLSPKAYLKEENGPFKNTKEAIEIFFQAFNKVNAQKQKGLPFLYFGITLRQDKDFSTNNKLDKEKIQDMASLLNKVYKEGKIKNLAFLGQEKFPLKEFRNFFEALNSNFSLIILVGQRLPEDTRSQKERKRMFLQNASYASMIAKKFKKIMLWGLHDLDILSPQETEKLRQILPEKIELLLTLTFDRLTGIVKEDNHPVERLIRIKPRARIRFGTGNSALTYGSYAVTFDIFTYYGNLGFPLGNITDIIKSN